MESSSEEQNSINKTTGTRVRARRASSAERERASRRSISDEPRKEVRKAVEAPDPELERQDKNESRKAPTSLASKKKFLSQKRKSTIIATAFILVGVGASAAIGMTDSGPIDVNKTIEERNERIRSNTADERDAGGSMIEVPVQNTNTERRGDGGLRGSGIVNTPPAPPIEIEASTSTASSSDETVPTEGEANDEEVTAETTEEDSTDSSGDTE